MRAARRYPVKIHSHVWHYVPGSIKKRSVVSGYSHCYRLICPECGEEAISVSTSRKAAISESLTYPTFGGGK